MSCHFLLWKKRKSGKKRDREKLERGAAPRRGATHEFQVFLGPVVQFNVPFVVRTIVSSTFKDMVQLIKEISTIYRRGSG